MRVVAVGSLVLFWLFFCPCFGVLAVLALNLFWLRVVLLEMAEGLGLEEVEEGIEDVERDYMAGN